MDNTKSLIVKNIENNIDELKNISDKIFDNPEMKFQENMASKILTNFLTDELSNQMQHLW